MYLKKLIAKIETLPLSAGGFFFTFVAIVAVRTCFEFLLEPSRSVTLFDSFFYSLVDYIHILLSWLSLFLSVVLWLKVIYKKDIFKIINLVLAGFCVIWIVPLIDFIFYSGIEISYRYDFSTFWHTFIHLFNPFVSLGHISTGVRIEVAVVLVFVSIYGRVIKQSFLQILGAVFGVYTIIFTYGYLPAIYAYILNIDFFTIVAHSVLIEKSLVHLTAYIYIVPLTVQAAVLLYLMPKNIQKSFLYIARFERMSIYLGIFLLAAFLALKNGLGGMEVLNFYDINKTLAAILSIACAFIYASVINDVSDEMPDKISNAKRVLVQQLLSKQSFIELGNIFLFLSIVFAVTVNRHFVFLIFGILALSYLYSKPPFYLKRFFLLSHLTLSLIALLVGLLGFCFVEANLAFQKADAVFLSATVIFYFIASHLKDIKDHKADKAYGIVTLATIMGKKKAFYLLQTTVAAVLFILGFFVMDIGLFFAVLLTVLFFVPSMKINDSEKSILLAQLAGFATLVYYVLSA
jgi:4-hydroxybenzoate polyprenyltransferase